MPHEIGGLLAWRVEVLLEPVVRVGVVVEGGHLPVAGPVVQGDRLVERPMRVQAYQTAAEARRLRLQRSEQPRTNAQSAHLGIDSQALDLCPPVTVKANGAASGRASHRAWPRATGQMARCGNIAKTRSYRRKIDR